MKSTCLISFGIMMTLLSSMIFIATAANVNSEIYDNHGGKLAGFSGINGEDANTEKAEKRTFFVGSRYGRSQSDTMNMEGKSEGARIVPRNDRYFFGSRYGKRSSISAFDDDQNQSLSCFYTGITNLYRCVDQSNDENV